VKQGLFFTAALGLVLVAASASAPVAAAELRLSNLRLENAPTEAYGPAVFHADYAGARRSLVRLWWRLVREGKSAEPTAVNLARERFGASAGTVSYRVELGEPGPRVLTVWVEDELGMRSSPVDMRFEPVEPSPPMEALEYTSDGLRIQAYLYRPRNVSPAPTIVWSHGSRRRHELAEKLTYKWLGYRLARLGYAVLVAERRGYGGSEGTGIVGDEGFDTLRFGLPGEVRDVAAAADHLKSRPGIDARRIVLAGYSLGGLVSLLAAAQRSDLRGVASFAGGYGFDARMMGPEMLLVQDEMRTAANRIRAPTLLLHSENDRIVPVDFSRVVAERLAQAGVPVTLKTYPPFKVGGHTIEGHHIFGRVDALPVFWKDFTDFLATVLKP
jgi:dienelactone hydrolase